MSLPKNPKRCIGDIFTLLEAFSIYCLILVSYFPIVGKISSSINSSYFAHITSFPVGCGYPTTKHFDRMPPRPV